MFSAAKKIHDDIIICSLGWNCYPGWLLRDLYSQPAYPWDWMQFFDQSVLKNFLTENGITEVVSGYSIKNVVPGLEMDLCKPHFWSNSLKVRSPHDHEKVSFSNIDKSKEMIQEKLYRRLDRLRKSCNGKVLIFLGNYNHGCYGMEGYCWLEYIRDMSDFVKSAMDSLSPRECSLLLCGNKRPYDSRVFSGGDLDLARIDQNIFFAATAYSFEDAYFKSTSDKVDIKLVRHKYWPDVLPGIVELTRGG